MINCAYCSNFETCDLKRADRDGEYYEIYCDCYRSITDIDSHNNFYASINKNPFYLGPDDEFFKKLMVSLLFD